MKSKFVSLLTAAVMLMSVFGAFGITASATSLEGAGTEKNPFLACDEASLRMIADFPDAYWKLSNDIELTQAWSPISEFTGTLDGSGYKVSGISISDKMGSWPNEAAFFKVNKGTIKNFMIDGTVNYSSSHLGGAIFVYENYGLISGCGVTGTANLHLSNAYSQNASTFGGFVSANYSGGVIENCYSRITISGSYGGGNYKYLNGSMGFINTNYGTIRNCYSASEAASNYVYASFCCSVQTNSAIESCYYDKDLSGYTTEYTNYGLPKTTAAMKMEYNYAGWDFDTVWAIDESINDGYPYLQSEKSVTVRATGIALDKASASIREGSTVALTPIFTPSNASNKNVSWSTSSKYVATVDENGVVTGVSEGTATITATAEDGGYTASCVVTVTPAGTEPEYPSGTCGNNLTWKLQNGVLTISGAGAMTEYSRKEAPWYECADEIKSIVVENGVTGISGYAFADCSAAASVSLPQSLASVGECAFDCCASLENINIPDNVTQIGDSAFYGCEALKTVNIPSSVTSVGKEAFDGCYALEAIEVDAANSVYSSADGVLFDKDNTTLMIYPEGKNDTEYTVPSGVNTIAFGAFYMNFNLEKLYISAEVTELEDYSIWLCGDLTICAPSSSAAHTYADANEIPFSATDGTDVTLDYTVNSVTTEETSEGNFRVRAKVTKNTDLAGIHAVIIALYDKSGVMVDHIFMEAEFAKGQTVNFGGVVKDTDGIKVKAFVWNSLSDMKPLSNAVEKQ